MNTFKKVIAGVSTLAIVAATTVSVNAAAVVSSATLTDANTITVTTTGVNFATDTEAVTTLVVSDSTGAAVAGIDATDVTEIDGSFTIDVTTETATFDANETFSVSYLTDAGDFGAAVFATTDTTTSEVGNEVKVTATVVPVLNMAITNAAVDLGNLDSTSEVTSGTDTGFIIKTNAASGYKVQASATAFTGTTTSHAIAFTDSTTNVAGTEGFSIDVVNLVDSATANTGTTTATASFAVDTSAADLVTSDGPTDGDTFDVNYEANISAVTPADEYATTVTYTLTGSF
jgi:hypothetical protein